MATGTGVVTIPPNIESMEDGTSGMPDQADVNRNKRRLVSADNNDRDLPDPKQPAITLNKDMKKNIHKALAITYIRICNKLQIIYINPPETQGGVSTYTVTGEYHDVIMSNNISNLIFTAHRLLRHKAALRETATTKSGPNVNEFTVGGQKTKITNDEVAEILKTAFSLFGFQYTKPAEGDNNHWYGTAGPIIALSVLHKTRRDELRLGHNQFCVGADAKGYKFTNVSQYGLSSQHHVLLEGLRIPPSKKSSLAQSVGPMTTLIMLLGQKGNEDYTRKWVNSAKRALAHIPDNESIIEALKGKSAESSRELLASLADLLLITEGREANRAAFPWNALSFALLSTTQIGYYVSTNADGVYLNVRDNMPDAPLLDVIDYSGKGMWLTYQAISTFNFRCPASYGEEFGPQILFHCIFGTYKEDLSLLSQITTIQNWYTRKQIGNALQKSGSQAATAVVRLPGVKYYSKLKSANITGLLTSANNQITSSSVFSGRAIKTFGENFFETLEKNPLTTSVTGKTASALSVGLRSLKQQLLQDIGKDTNSGRIDIGTVDWLSMPIRQVEQTTLTKTSLRKY